MTTPREAPSASGVVAPWHPSEVFALINYQKRDARPTHDPRYSDIGPSLTFAIIAAPSRSTRNVKTTKSRHRHDMRLSRFRNNRDRCNEFLRADFNLQSLFVSS